MLRRDGVGPLHPLGHHAGKVAAPFATAEHDLVGDEVERLLVLALNVDAAGRAARAAHEPAGPPQGRMAAECEARRHLYKRAAGDGAGDVLARGLDVVDERDQLGAAREPALFLDEEL